MQPAASPVMESIVSFHNLLLVLITVITLFVLALSWPFAVVKLNAKANPVPSSDHPQHADRGGLDADFGADPRRHRRPLFACCSSNSIFQLI